MESQLRTFEQAFIRRKSVDSLMLMKVLQIKRNLVLKNGVVPAQLLRRLQTDLNWIQKTHSDLKRLRLERSKLAIFGQQMPKLTLF